MTRSIAGGIGLVAVFAAGAALAQTKPNFSGTWVAVSGSKEAIGQETWIKHDATSITIGHGGSVEHSQTYRLDGQEEIQPDLAHPADKTVTVARWDGDTIVIVVKMSNGARHKRTLTVQPDGTMVFEVATEVGGKVETLKAVHKRKTEFLDRTVRIQGTDHRYQVYVPANYDATTRWPVILFLHGAGERGADGVVHTKVGLGRALGEFPSRYPAIVVLPQAPAGTTWVGDQARIAMAALEKTLHEFSTDRDRVYLTGLSMGGQGAWSLAYAHRDQFAAAVVVCGFIGIGSGPFASFMPADAADPPAALAARLRTLPVWVYHGDADRSVPVDQSRTVVASLEAAGADVRYTELPGVGHNSWDAAYGSPEVAEWLFRQRRRQ
jgi:predicted peptidase